MENLLVEKKITSSYFKRKKFHLLHTLKKKFCLSFKYALL